MAKLKGTLQIQRTLQGRVISHDIRSYDELQDKPSINGVVLAGNKSDEDLGLMQVMEEVTNTEIEEMFRLSLIHI